LLHLRVLVERDALELAAADPGEPQLGPAREALARMRT
jgi:DNA-binding GntR family transcriptional regulator